MSKTILTLFFALYSTPDGQVHKMAKIMPSYESCLMVMHNPVSPDIKVYHKECKLVEFDHPEVINRGALDGPKPTTGTSNTSNIEVLGARDSL